MKLYPFNSSGICPYCKERVSVDVWPEHYKEHVKQERSLSGQDLPESEIIERLEYRGSKIKEPTKQIKEKGYGLTGHIPFIGGKYKEAVDYFNDNCCVE